MSVLLFFRLRGADIDRQSCRSRSKCHPEAGCSSKSGVEIEYSLGSEAAKCLDSQAGSSNVSKVEISGLIIQVWGVFVNWPTKTNRQELLGFFPGSGVSSIINLCQMLEIEMGIDLRGA